MYTHARSFANFLLLTLFAFGAFTEFASAAITTCPGRPNPLLSWSSSNIIASGCTLKPVSNNPVCEFGATPDSTGSKTVANGTNCTVTLSCEKSGSVLVSNSDELIYDSNKVWDGSACVTPALTAPIFSASCTQQANGTYNITVRWSPVANATNYPLRLVNPNTSVETDIGYGVAGDSAPTASPYTFTGQSGAGTYSGWGHAWNSTGWSAASAFSATCGTTPKPDLTAEVPTPTTATVGTQVTFTSLIKNIGVASTGSSFYNFFQFSTDGLVTIQDGAYQSMSTLNAGLNQSATWSPTPSAPGTFYTRACADKQTSGSAGTISESNEGNNCSGWTTVTISCPSGTSWNGTTCAASAPPTDTSGTSFIDIFFN